ncbi:MAG TPA: prephenate dehydrogenase/arogenate dehydrogenase family protein [Candidatus Acidoferrum sp.]|nr:prephenate dehydrogenase/arogenate dehydrogenase family protein [Candidatus Acidoferrum sp.]
MTPKVLGIFGVGLIGGSIGLRARGNGLHVIGYDSDPSALEEARVIGAIDAVESFDELPRRTDALVVAAHLGATLGEIERLRQRSDARCALMLDVASVKAPVVAVARGLKNFVATHPMAGSERSGASNARGDLFEGRPWAYVPTGDADLDARACKFIESLGALPLAIGAEDHDRIVAIASHVPQVVAYRYTRLLQEKNGAERLCGPVARELLRIASMDPAMWREILSANATNVESDLRRLAAELELAADELAARRPH